MGAVAARLTAAALEAFSVLADRKGRDEFRVGNG